MPRIAWCAVCSLVLAGTAPAATRCPPGTFTPLLIVTVDVPFGAGSPSGAFVVGDETITMAACGSAPLRVRARRHLTMLRAVWGDCPGFGRVRYQGWTNYPACKALVSVIRWRDQTTNRRRALKFEALRAE